MVMLSRAALLTSEILPLRTVKISRVSRYLLALLVLESVHLIFVEHSVQYFSWPMLLQSSMIQSTE